MSLLRKSVAANSSIFTPSEAATVAMIHSASHRVRNNSHTFSPLFDCFLVLSVFTAHLVFDKMSQRNFASIFYLIY